MQRAVVAIFAVAVLAMASVGRSQAAVLAEYTNEGAAPAGGRVFLQLAVKQTGADWLLQTLHEVSDPRSPRYGQYLDHATLAANVHGEPAAVAKLTALLKDMNVNYTMTFDNSFMQLDVTVEEASRLLEADFYTFRHSRTGAIYYRTTKTELPRAIADHVDFVLGHKLMSSGRPSTLRISSQVPELLGTTPQSIDQAYKLNGYTSNNANNSQAIAAFLKQYFSPKDLAAFQKKFSLPSRPITKVVGPNEENNPGDEANLDVQYIAATGRNISTWFISTGKTSNKGQEDFLYWITTQVGDASSPWVHSVSYGDVESSIDLSYRTRVDIEFQKFGTLGRTIMIAAGDSGVSCSGGKFQPDWPTSSPYVTSVGGSTNTPEVAWPFGGSGFSNTYGMPSYQRSAVQAYLNSGVAPESKYFNASGRAYPDVAAFATNFAIFMNGFEVAVSGTSCSTPTFAGVVASLNDVRMSAGKSTLGFLNPLLYQIGSSSPQAFNDIVSGSNPSGACPGFKAAKGWDAVTGWGSPNFSELRQLV